MSTSDALLVAGRRIRTRGGREGVVIGPVLAPGRTVYEVDWDELGRQTHSIWELRTMGAEAA